MWRNTRALIVKYDNILTMANETKKILLSGIQPSGRPHIGNYFGMMKQMVDYQKEHEMYLMIADYHAMKSVQDAKSMRENIIGVLLDFLAIGLDPKKVTIFKQSDVSEHTELAWIFDTITTMPYLMRAHAFKDAEAKNKEIDVGTFNYPMLMSADILIYNADIVPVGQDQKQHIEIARDTAIKFNNKFGETFKMPNAMIIKDVAIVPGTDGQKMSKSYGNTIPLFAEYEEIKKCVMSIVTDSSGGIPKNVYAIHNLLRPASELLPLYESKAGKYKELKDLLVEDLENFIAPMREKRKKLEKTISKVIKILKDGGVKAKKVASKKMQEVKKKVGVSVYEK
ncbi:MAG: Tryptophan--tRNA ligase [Patescibacteria group bacterium]|nr:Tryptophan--tRNA ligase [Patescibacteria group bacterium]